MIDMGPDTTERPGLQEQLRELQLRLARPSVHPSNGATRSDPSVKTADLGWVEPLDPERDCLFGVDQSGIIRFQGATASTVLGYQAAVLVTILLADLVHPQDTPALARLLERTQSSDKLLGPIQIRLRHAERFWTTCEAVCAPVQTGERFDGAVIYLRDLTRMSRPELAAELGEGLFERFFDGAAAGMAMADPEGRVLRCNAAFARLLGSSPREIRGRSLEQLSHPQDVAEERALRHAVVIGRRPSYRVDQRLLRRDGTVCWALLHLSLLRGAGGRPEYLVLTAEDVTERHRLEEQLQIGSTAFQHSKEGIVVTDSGFRIAAANHAATRITGYAEEELRGRPVSFLGAGERQDTSFREISAIVRRRGEWDGEVWDRRRSGEVFPQWLSVRAVPTDGEEPQRYVAVFSDLTAKRISERRIQFLTQHDPLTELPNRALFKDRLRRAIMDARHNDGWAVLFVLDIDRFKAINDSLGHQPADTVLRTVGRRLADGLRRTDTLARVGSDEFAIVVTEISNREEAARAARSTIKRIVAALAPPIEIEDRELFLTASVGVSLSPQDAQISEELVQKAEAALYHAKRQGGGTYRFFAEGMTHETQDRLVLDSRLRKALEQDLLKIHYQPQMDTASGQIVGFEALMRWSDSHFGDVSPGTFIPLAEETGLIIKMGEWVLKEACDQIVSWQRLGLLDVRVAVNLSAVQFRDDQLLESVERVMAMSGIDPRLVELEITEGTFMEDTQRSVSTLKALKEMGVALAIDDFGTGYSSLAYLRNFPVDRLKIDQSFVADIGVSSDGPAIVNAVVELGHGLGLEVVAEGVETEEQLDFLRSKRCDLVQGYLVGRPAPADVCRFLLDASVPEDTGFEGD